MKKVILIAGVVVVVIAGIWFYNFSHQRFVAPKPSPVVTLGGKLFSVEIADTPATQERGLSGHAPLSDGQGMLFVFDKSDNYGFWMKDMTFPIDIVWLNSDMKIAHIEKSVFPETYPKVFYPNALTQYVLEISAGQSDILHLKTGDSVFRMKGA